MFFGTIIGRNFLQMDLFRLVVVTPAGGGSDCGTSSLVLGTRS